MYLFSLLFSLFFFFNDTATTEIYTLSLHDALPISQNRRQHSRPGRPGRDHCAFQRDRKSTRLNSSHSSISYAVFCLKKKNKNNAAASIIKRGGCTGLNPKSLCVMDR